MLQVIYLSLCPNHLSMRDFVSNMQFSIQWQVMRVVESAGQAVVYRTSSLMTRLAGRWLY